MGEFTSVHMTVGQGFTYVLGMIVAGITGYLVIRFMLKLSNQVRLRYFAFYSLQPESLFWQRIIFDINWESLTMAASKTTKKKKENLRRSSNLSVTAFRQRS